MISDKPKQTLPHREPFIWVSRLIEREPDGSRGIVEFDVTPDLDIFKGHFPGNPIFPGVLQLEAAAQATFWIFKGVLPEGTIPPLGLFVGIDTFKFKKPVVPPSVLRMKVTQLEQRSLLYKWNAELFVESSLVSTGRLWLYMSAEDKKK